MVVLHNFSRRPQVARFTLDMPGGDSLINLLANEQIRADRDGVHRVALEAHGYRWYRVGGLGYALTIQRDSGAGEEW